MYTVKLSSTRKHQIRAFRRHNFASCLLHSIQPLRNATYSSPSSHPPFNPPPISLTSPLPPRPRPRSPASSPTPVPSRAPTRAHSAPSSPGPSPIVVDAAIGTSTTDLRAPIYPEAMRALYFMYLCACLVERTWRFALPLCLAYVEGGYQAIAVLGFVSPLACSLIGPAAGRLLDKMYRPYGLSLMVGLQGLAIIASGLVLLAATASTTVQFTDGPLFVALLVLSMVERLTAICSELVIERDWVTQLSGKDNAFALASSNAMLRRTDLMCELVGSLAFGWLYSGLGLSVSVASATFLAAALLPAQLLSIFKVSACMYVCSFVCLLLLNDSFLFPRPTTDCKDGPRSDGSWKR